MIICLANDNEILWMHEDDSVKELAEYQNDDLVIVINKEVNFLDFPNDGHYYVNKWDATTETVYLEKVIRELTHEEVTQRTHGTVEVSSVDNLMNMDMLISIDEKLTKIMQHLNLQ